MARVDLDSCGSTKGCLLYPTHCTGSDCIAAASFLYRADSDDFMVELMSNTAAAENYISVAFSQDKTMVSWKLFILRPNNTEKRYTSIENSSSKIKVVLSK